MTKTFHNESFKELRGFYAVCNNIFPIIDICRFFFISAIDPDILRNVLENCIMFLIGAAWVLFNFYLKQKQRFLAWSYTENPSFLFFYERMRSIYSGKIKFKKTDFFSPKITKTLKKCKFQR